MFGRRCVLQYKATSRVTNESMYITYDESESKIKRDVQWIIHNIFSHHD